MNTLLPMLCAPASGRNTTANRLNEAALVVTAENRTPYRDSDGNRYPPLTIADMEVIPTTSSRLRRKDRRAARAADKAAWQADVAYIMGGGYDADASRYDHGFTFTMLECALDGYEGGVPEGGYMVGMVPGVGEPVTVVDYAATDEDLLAEFAVESYDELADLVDATGMDVPTSALYGSTFDPTEVQWAFTVSDRPVGSHGGTPRKPTGPKDEAGRWLATHDLASVLAAVSA